MTEYWVSKKQYWCKYCSIYIRDDAPSRRQHETGGRHIGAKERFIRDLYRTGNIAKREKQQEAQEMARIDAAAAAAHAQDTGVAGPSRSSILYAQNHQGPAAAPKKPPKPTDKFANYSTAAQLGLMEEEAPSTFEIDQLLKNRDTKAGQWEEVVTEPTGQYSAGGAGPAQDEDEEGEGWKFQHKGKRPVRDPYDDDDFDPGAIAKMRKRNKPGLPVDPILPSASDDSGLKRELDREGWSGKIDLDGGLSPKKKDGMVYQPGGGWVKLETGPDGLPPLDDDTKPEVVQTADDGTHSAAPTNPPTDEEAKPAIGSADVDTKPAIAESSGNTAKVTATSTDGDASSGGLFKKRRPPPSSRKK